MPTALGDRILAGLRLTHPFPSLLDGLVVGGTALIAGGSVPVALRLGIAMTLLQAAIGIVNDVVDAPRDGGRMPPKPIPAGLVSRSGAWVAAGAVAVVGVALAAGSGAGLALLAGLVLLIGFAYDLVLKGTAWSWVPFALGIPILPVFGWAGTGVPLAGWFAALIPAAMLAGAALAIVNARADVEVDQAADVSSVATELGLGRSWWVASTLFGIVVAVALVTVLDPDGPMSAGVGSVVGLAAGVVILGVGAVLGRGATPTLRERAWELQAIGVAVLAAGWLSSVATRPG